MGVKILKALIGLVPLCFAAAFYFTGTLGGMAALAEWRSGSEGCPASQTVAGQDIARQMSEQKSRFQAEFKKIAQDGKYQQWSTSAGAYWYAWQPGELDALVLAESAADQYGSTRIKPGDVVVDCGANVGTFTRRALDRGAGKVVALEINPLVRELLRRTFAKEIGEGRLVVYDAGVWDSDTELDLVMDSVVLERKGEKQRVKVRTIDNILRDLGVAKVNFIKMDIEGAEKPALRGAVAALAQLPELAMAAEHLDDDRRAIPALLHQLTGGRYRATPVQCLLRPNYTSYPQILWFSAK